MEPGHMKAVSNHTCRLFDVSVPCLETIDGDYILVMVNSPSMSVPLAQALWTRCSLKVCADGAANRLFDGLLPEYRETYVPDAICGDLDSISPDILTYYRNQGSAVVQDSNQDNNDLHKSLEYLIQAVNECATIKVVLVLGAFGGRFDQEMANVQSLFVWKGKFKSVMLLSEENIAFILEGSKYLSSVDRRKVEDCIGHVFSQSGNETHSYEGLENCFMHRITGNFGINSSCGLIPIAGAVRAVWTKGLKWDLSGELVQFGGLISTSNTYNQASTVEGLVIVANSDDILWTSEFTFLS